EAAVAAAGDAEAIPLDPRVLRQRRVDAVHDVDVVPAAPVQLDAALELLAVAGGAARVGEEHRPAVRRVDLELVIPVEAELAGRAAVNCQDHRILPARLPADRLHEEAVDVPAIRTLERHAFDRHQLQLLVERRVQVRELPRTPAVEIGDVEVVEVRRIVFAVGDPPALLVDVDEVDG